MSLARALEAGRAAALELMVDTCAVSRPVDGQPAFDPLAGYVDIDDTDVYVGKCRVQGRDVSERQVAVGEQESTLLEVTVQLPLDAVGVIVGDRVTISAVHEGGDSDLVGRVFNVVGIERKSHATARRLRCEEVIS